MPQRNAGISLVWCFGLLTIGSVGATAWGLSSRNIAISVNASREFSLDTDMDSFRHILVRTDATEAILEYCGMKLLEETTEAVDIDLSGDSRPLRNFLRGKSKANVSATKHLRVQLNDPQISTIELLLTQECHISPKLIRIETTADAPTGELLSYCTILEAVRGEHGTDISLTIEMTVEVNVSILFESEARYRVDQAAVKALEEQEKGLRILAENPASDLSGGLIRAGR